MLMRAMVSFAAKQRHKHTASIYSSLNADETAASTEAVIADI